MPPREFYEQLAALGAEYAAIEDENQRLSALLNGGCVSSQHGRGGVATSVPLKPGQAHLDTSWFLPLADQCQMALEDAVEMVLPPRSFQLEATHGVALGVVPGCSSSPAGSPQHGPLGFVPDISDDDMGPHIEDQISEVSFSQGLRNPPVHEEGLPSSSTPQVDTHDQQPVGFASKPSSDKKNGVGRRPSNDSSAQASSGDESPQRRKTHFEAGMQFGRRLSGGLLPGRAASEEHESNRVTAASPDDLDSAPDEEFEHKPKPFFANVESMKTNVRLALLVDAYDVKTFYKDSGLWQSIARHPTFEIVALAVIGLNAVWVGIDTDHNDQELLLDAHPVFQAAEHIFCTLFTGEVVIRFFAFKYKRDCLRDQWFFFDACLVILMILDTWVINLAFSVSAWSGGGGRNSDLANASILRLARLLRLTRMARMARLMRALPELMVLMKGMAAAARSVFFTLVLLCVLLYMFAIAFTQLLAKDTSPAHGYFSGIPRSMHTLWVYATLIDEISELMGVLEEVRSTPPILMMMLLNVFILVASLTVMNMLVGILVEVVSAVAVSEREEVALSLVRNKLERIFSELGLEVLNDATISKDDFQRIIETPEAARLIQDLGVDVIQMVDVADTLFAGECGQEFKNLSFGQFMEAVQQMRGNNTCTVKDLVDLRKFITKEMEKQETKQRANSRVNTLRGSSKQSVGSLRTAKTLDLNALAAATEATSPREASVSSSPKHLAGLARSNSWGEKNPSSIGDP